MAGNGAVPSPGEEAAAARNAAGATAVLQQAVDEAVRLMAADGALIALLDEEGRLRFAHEAGETAARVRRWRTTIEGSAQTGGGLIRTAITTGRLQSTGNYTADESFPHARDADRIVDEIGIRTLIAAPLLLDGRSIGVLAIYAARPEAFSERDIALARALADHAAASIGNARLIERLATSESQLARRVDIEHALALGGSRLASLHDPAEVLQTAVQEAARLLDADGALLDLLDPATGVIRWAYDAGVRDDRHRDILRNLELRLGEGMFGTAIAEGVVLVTEDYLADPRFHHSEGADWFAREAGIASMIAAPLVGDGGPLGVLGVYSARTKAYGPDEASLAGSFATQATIALTNARLIGELEASRAEVARRADAERTLREIGAQISALRDREDVVQQTVDEAVRLLDADGARIDLVSDAGLLRGIYVAGADKPSEEEWPTTPDETLDQGVSGMATTSGTSFRTDDYLADERFHHGSGPDHYVELKGIRSVLAAPLLTDGGAIGAVSVWSTRRAAFGDRHESLLEALATQASVALTNARLIDELKRSRRDIERRADAERALREIGARISAIHERTDVLQQVVDEAARLLGADGARIDLLDPASEEIRWAYATEGIAVAEMERANPAVRRGEGIAGLVIDRAEPFLTADYITDARFVHVAEADDSARISGVRSLLAVPLRGDAGNLGALSVIATRPDAFDDSDTSLLEGLAVQASVALSNARLIDELAGSRAALASQVDAEQALREIATAISAIHDQGSVLQKTVEEAARLLGADEAILELLDPEDPTLLRWAFDSGIRKRFDPRYVSELTLPVGVGLTGRAVAERRVLIANDDLVNEFPQSPESEQFFATTGFRSMIAAPIVGETGALGAIEVYSKLPHSFEEADGELIRALATQAAIAISNARRIDELARSREELERAADTERALREIAAGITAIRDPDEVLQRIVDEAQRLLGSDGAHVTLMAEEGTHLTPVVAAGVDDDTRRWMLDLVFPLHGGINGLAASLRRPVTTDDYLVDPRFPHEPVDQYVAARLGIRGCAVVPLRGAADEVIGTLAISYRTTHELGEDEVGLLQILADQASIAVTNARLDALLRDSEARYRHLVQNSPDLVWAIDSDARFIFLSETCERLTGWRPDDLLGGHFGGLVHPSSQDVAEIDWSAGLTNGRHELRGRVNLLHRDGHPIPAEFRAISQIEDGAFVGANGTVRDMSERDRLERELRSSEERYRFLVENAPDIVYATDAEGHFTFMSETIERVTGYTPEESVGRHFSFLVAEGSTEAAAARWQALAESPARLQVVELDLRGKDGSIIPAEVSAMGLTDASGAFAGIHGATRDISERRRFEREIRESEERYRYLVKASPDVVWAVDADGTITFMGDRIAELTGWTPDEVIGQQFDFLTTPDVVPQAQETWEAVKRDPGYVYPLRVGMPRKTGDPIPVEIWVTGSVHEGRFVGAHGSIRDMRENERLVGDLRRQAADLAASDERAHLARELHDSVTQALFSMTLITRSVEVLLERDPSAAGQQLKTLRDLQKDALAEMRSLIFELRPGGLAEEGLVTALRRHAAAVQGRIGLPVVVEADLPDRAPVDVEDALYRIAQEALHNVVKHAGARTVRLSLERRAADIRMAVVDDGTGFDAAEVPPGHLGLAGMRARAEKIGGRLTVDSKKGRGTRIEVVVPQAT